MRQSPVKCLVEIQNEIPCQNRGTGGKKVQKVATEAASANKNFWLFL